MYSSRGRKCSKDVTLSCTVFTPAAFSHTIFTFLFIFPFTLPSTDESVVRRFILCLCLNFRRRCTTITHSILTLRVFLPSQPIAGFIEKQEGKFTSCGFIHKFALFLLSIISIIIFDKCACILCEYKVNVINCPIILR